MLQWLLYFLAFRQCARQRSSTAIPLQQLCKLAVAEEIKLFRIHLCTKN